MNGTPTDDPRGLKGSGGTADGGTSVGSLAGHGFVFVVAILLGLKGGEWLDRKLGTAPLFLFVGLFTMAGASFYSMYSKLMAAQRREDEAKAARRAEQASRTEPK